MGIEPEFRCKGIGKTLIELALDWLKVKTNIEWIDLAVFAQNAPAYTTYKKFGFQEVGRISDRYRIYNTSIDNVEMVLKIER